MKNKELSHQNKTQNHKTVGWQQLYQTSYRFIITACFRLFATIQKTILTTIYLDNLAPNLANIFKFLVPYKNFIHSISVFSQPGFALLFGTIAQWFKIITTRNHKRRNQVLTLISLVATTLVLINPLGLTPTIAALYGGILIAFDLWRTATLIKRTCDATKLAKLITAQHEGNSSDRTEAKNVIKQLKKSTYFEEAEPVLNPDEFSYYCLHKAIHRGLKTIITALLIVACGISMTTPLVGLPMVVGAVVALGLVEINYKYWFRKKYKKSDRVHYAKEQTSMVDTTFSKNLAQQVNHTMFQAVLTTPNQAESLPSTQEQEASAQSLLGTQLLDCITRQPYALPAKHLSCK